ncbi:hypothetical protein [Jiella pelagia]|uniref:Uncharacterized protein n=1 Tax=Jiella pelagia TaxID=2986949 RepID=A0ABY7BZ03_9HYPH|nr:hypothetical protein [Jiella pelagia]WAP69059.1 hypothetical protein OH818_01610 [Jiella pelagia]
MGKTAERWADDIHSIELIGMMKGGFRKACAPIIQQAMDEAAAQEAALVDGLVEKVQAVIDRWETPLWKDVPATAGYIYEMRDALAQVNKAREGK